MFRTFYKILLLNTFLFIILYIVIINKVINVCQKVIFLADDKELKKEQNRGLRLHWKRLRNQKINYPSRSKSIC
jgi:hypothetical protein